MKEERLISLDTAKLAKEKLFGWRTKAFYSRFGNITYPMSKTYSERENILRDWNFGKLNCEEKNILSAPAQSFLQKWIRETLNIHIDVYRNAMGWQVNLEKADSGTHICVVEGYDDGNEYEDALEEGLIAALEQE